MTLLRLGPGRPPDNPTKDEVKLHSDSPGKEPWGALIIISKTLSLQVSDFRSTLYG